MTRAAGSLAVSIVAVSALLAGVADLNAAKQHGPLAQVMTRQYPALVAASRSGGLTPESAQALYDAARNLENALPATVNASCRALLAALHGFGAAEVAAADWFDRLDSARSAAAIRSGLRFESRVGAVRRSCREGAETEVTVPAPLLTPGRGEAFTGAVDARAPEGAARGEIHVDGTNTGVTVPVVGGRARGVLTRRPGPIDRLEVVFRSPSGVALSRAISRSVWLLPVTAWHVTTASKESPVLSKQLMGAAKGFPGISGSWVAHLDAGTHGSWNDTSLFPAASTVKLGLMAAALRRYRPGSQQAQIDYELRAIAGWSSNLAANRLLRLLGGERPAEAALDSLGATSSTYTGTYRAGTSSTRLGEQPPLVSRRVTTARDLGSMLESFVRLAGGDPGVARRTGLSAADGRLLIGLLLRSQKQGENLGLFTPSVPDSVPIAQKSGWISSARHTAAVLFMARGPVVTVLVTYQDGLDRADAQRLGSTVARLALRPANG